FRKKYRLNLEMIYRQRDKTIIALINMVDLTKDFLSSRFSMKDMGKADVILGSRYVTRKKTEEYARIWNSMKKITQRAEKVPTSRKKRSEEKKLKNESFGMGTLSLVSEYLKDLEECMDDGDSRVAKEAKLFDALEHKSVVIEVDNQKIAIFTKAPLRAFGEPFMRYSLPCKVDGQGAWDAELDLADSANYVMEKK
ncbi:hypothetical protein Tco_0885814, partial [Tanacetum coccineum]